MGEHINPRVKRMPLGTRYRKKSIFLLIAVLRSQSHPLGDKSIHPVVNQSPDDSMPRFLQK